MARAMRLASVASTMAPSILASSREALGAEGGVEQEPAGADVEHVGTVADDDQGAHARLQDAVEALTQGLSGRDRGQGVEHGLTAPPGHRTSLDEDPPTAAGRRASPARSVRLAYRRRRLGRSDRRRTGSERVVEDVVGDGVGDLRGIDRPQPGRGPVVVGPAGPPDPRPGASTPDGRARAAARRLPALDGEPGGLDGLGEGAHPDGDDAVGRLGGQAGQQGPRGSRGGRPRPAAGRSGRPGAARRRGRPRRRRPGRRAGPGRPAPRPGPGRGRGRRPARRPSPRRRRGRRRRSRRRRSRPARRARPAAATRRPESRPWAERRGEASRLGVTRAWSSTSSGRWPSMVGTTTEPETPLRRSARNSRLGSGTPIMPPSVISNRPSWSVAPKRCFTARRRRRAWWRSPSKASTVSTTCSSTRGPARPPSLVTWPTRTTAMPRPLAACDQAGRALADLRHRARAPSRCSGWWTVWMESTTTTVGLDLVDEVEDVGNRGLRRQPQAWAAASPAARPAGAPAAWTPRPRRRAPWRRRRRWTPPPAAAGWTCRCRAHRRPG